MFRRLMKIQMMLGALGVVAGFLCRDRAATGAKAIFCRAASVLRTMRRNPWQGLGSMVVPARNEYQRKR